MVRNVFRTVGKIQREWMGIEPTRRLFSRHTGFEAQGGHQIRVHSRKVPLSLTCGSHNYLSKYQLKPVAKHLPEIDSNSYPKGLLRGHSKALEIGDRSPSKYGFVIVIARQTSRSGRREHWNPMYHLVVVSVFRPA